MRLVLVGVVLWGLWPVAIDAPDGVAVLNWTNDGAANAITIFNIDNAECPYPVAIDVGAGAQQTSIPEGPPYAARCLLKPGDDLYLLRYHDRQYVDQAGPYRVPYRVWAPMVAQ